MPESCTILHIEDSEADHVLFQRDLKKLQFTGNYRRVDNFDSAKKLLSGVSQDATQKPDLIVADSRLGVYNGLDIVRWVKARPELRDIPVVVYSSAIAPRQATDVLAAGAAACLTKPMDSAETLVALDIILGHIDPTRRCHTNYQST